MKSISLPFTKLFKVVIQGSSSWRLLIGAIISIGFSQSVILSTIGLMDGFLVTLKEGLNSSAGDLKITSRDGFFKPDHNLAEVLMQSDFLYRSDIIQSEGFLISDAGAKGVMIKGIDPESFLKVTGVKITFNTDHSIVVGRELALQLKLKKRDSIAIAFAKGNKELKGSAGVEGFEISETVTHGIYEKDLRFVYVKKSRLAEILGTKGRVNVVLAKNIIKDLSSDVLEQKVEAIEKQLDFNYRVRAFWSEFSGLIKAVEVEKFSLSFVLQLIVIVSIFNIAAFIIYITEKKSRDFFLFQAIGLSQRLIAKFWLKILFLIWLLGSILSILFTHLFSYILNHVELLKSLREIYFLESINLSLDFGDYVLVLGSSLVWVFIVTVFGIVKMSKKPIVSGLRQEFS
jgi:ABC-type lipoprotein release transport system permease subunit